MEYEFIGKTKPMNMSYLSTYGFVNNLVNGDASDSADVHIAQSGDLRYSTFWWRGQFVGRHDNNTNTFYRNLFLNLRV